MSSTQQTSGNIPKADDRAIELLQSLDANDFKNISFCDHLTTYSDDGKEMGSFSVSISSSSNGFGEGFLVKASSVGKIDGLPCGTKITALISNNMLETIRHRQHDFLFLKEDCLRRDTEILKQTNGFLITRCTSRAQDIQKTSRFVEARQAVGLISEGADLILQRLLAMKGYQRDFILISLDTNVNIASAQYERLAEENPEKGLTGISRKVIPWNDKPLTWHSHLTTKGRLVQRRRIDSSYTMKLVYDGNVVGGASCPGCENNGNQCLHPNFSNGKIKPNESDRTKNTKQRPELKTITTDFLHQLFFARRPKRSSLFAANRYLSALASESGSSEANTTVVGPA